MSSRPTTLNQPDCNLTASRESTKKRKVFHGLVTKIMSRRESKVLAKQIQDAKNTSRNSSRSQSGGGCDSSSSSQSFSRPTSLSYGANSNYRYSSPQHRMEMYTNNYKARQMEQQDQQALTRTLCKVRTDGLDPGLRPCSYKPMKDSSGDDDENKEWESEDHSSGDQSAQELDVPAAGHATTELCPKTPRVSHVVLEQHDKRRKVDEASEIEHALESNIIMKIDIAEAMRDVDQEEKSKLSASSTEAQFRSPLVKQRHHDDRQSECISSLQQFEYDSEDDNKENQGRNNHDNAGLFGSPVMRYERNSIMDHAENLKRMGSAERRKVNMFNMLGNPPRTQNLNLEDLVNDYLSPAPSPQCSNENNSGSGGNNSSYSSLFVQLSSTSKNEGSGWKPFRVENGYTGHYT